MDNTFSLKLGQGSCDGRGIGNKARLLHKAKAKGLPVPEGLIVSDELFQRALNNNALKTTGTARVFAESDTAQLKALLPELPTGPLAVRSAFSAEDTSASAMAGYFKSFLFVEPDEFTQKLLAVWNSASSFESPLRRDVLVMSMVDAKFAGVAFSEKNYQDDLVNYSSGTADALVSGQTAGAAFALPRLHDYEDAMPTFKDNAGQILPVFAERLARLLRDCRTVFDDNDWDVEWADDGAKCWLIQIRPITVKSRRNESFTIANHKEILPDLPSTFMTSIIESCSQEVLSYYTNFDNTLPHGRPFVEVYKGRPYINLSFLTEMMRHWGLPTALVTRSIGGTDDRDFAINTGRLLRKFPVLVKMGLKQLGSVGSSKRTVARMHELVAQPKDTFSECIENMRTMYKMMVCEMFSLTAAMSGPLAMVRKLNVLEEHSSRHDTISSRMYLDLEPLRQRVTAAPALRESLGKGQLPDDADFQELWQAYLEKHGHRGVYESDVARPRMRERPETVLTSLAHPAPARAAKPARTLTGFITAPIWWQASRTIRAREELRYNAMKVFEKIRINLLTLAQKHNMRPEDVFCLTIAEARAIDHGQPPTAEFLAAREKELNELAAYGLPDLVHRFDDLDPYSAAFASSNPAKKLAGISLTSGRVTGKALVLFEPVASLPEGFEPQSTILVARSVDAGWIPTFSLVAGVIVEIGGDLSHGSIILRETGIPATTNVQSATRLIKTGTQVALDAGTGKLEILD